MRIKLTFKQISSFVYGTVITCLLLIAGLVALSALNLPNGIKLFTVQSGSMEPAIHTGSVVVVRPQSAYKEKDIITFKTEDDRNNPKPKFTTTHRLTGITQTDSGLTYQTKGDANDAPDTVPTAPGLVIGKVMAAIPLLGYPVNFAKTREGLIFLIIIPATAIIYGEIQSIKNELVKLWQSRRKVQAE